MNPLITVAVATYNSAAYLQETLESIFNQTYENLALVISDDCSQDHTVVLAQEWIKQPKVQARFSSVEMITVPKNTGVSANCNRCLAAAKSEYMKFIAGDDILFPNCIQDNVDFIQQNPQARILFSQIKIYQDTFEDSSYLKTTPPDFPAYFFAEQRTAHHQYQLLLLSDRIHYTPSFFHHKQTVLSVGGYDQENRLVEDYPMWLKLTKSGVKLHYFHKPTVGYRVHSKATNNTGAEVLFKPSVLNSFQIRQNFAHAYLPWEIVASEYQVYYVSKWFQQMGLNHNTIWLKHLYRLLSVYLNPFQYIYAFNKRMPQNKTHLFYQ